MNQFALIIREQRTFIQIWKLVRSCIVANKLGPSSVRGDQAVLSPGHRSSQDLGQPKQVTASIYPLSTRLRINSAAASVRCILCGGAARDLWASVTRAPSMPQIAAAALSPLMRPVVPLRQPRADNVASARVRSFALLFLIEVSTGTTQPLHHN